MQGSHFSLTEDERQQSGTKQLERLVAQRCAIELRVLVSPVLGQAYPDRMNWLACCVEAAGIKIVCSNWNPKAREQKETLLKSLVKQMLGNEEE